MLASLSWTPPLLGALPHPQFLQLPVINSWWEPLKRTPTVPQRCQPTVARTSSISREAATLTFCGTSHFQMWEQIFLGTKHVLRASGLRLLCRWSSPHNTAQQDLAPHQGGGAAPSVQLPPRCAPPTPQKPDLNVLTASWCNVL